MSSGLNESGRNTLTRGENELLESRRCRASSSPGGRRSPSGRDSPSASPHRRRDENFTPLFSEGHMDHGVRVTWQKRRSGPNGLTRDCRRRRNVSIADALLVVMVFALAARPRLVSSRLASVAVPAISPRPSADSMASRRPSRRLERSTDPSRESCCSPRSRRRRRADPTTQQTWIDTMARMQMSRAR